MALIFGASAGITHALEKTPYHYVKYCSTPEQHEKEAERLLRESLSTGDIDVQHQLQTEAYEHYRVADILVNGPYKV